MTAVPKPPVHAKDAAFLHWLRLQPCLVCGNSPRGYDHVEAAHLQSCRYGDAENVVPLCGSAHHRECKHSLHQMGREKFQARWGIDLKAEAERLYQVYQEEMGCP